jgi:hypothetical protein
MSGAANGQVSRALPALVAALLQDPLRPSRELAAAGTRAVGLVGGDVPVELVLAAGALPVQLPAFADAATPLADKYLESGFALASRSIVEQWLTGRFDHFESVVFSRANDGAQRLYYYLCELQRRGVARGPRPLLYDLAKIPRATSVAHTLESTRRLAAELGADARHFGASIALRNRRRALFAQLAELRASTTVPDGAGVERLARASDLGPAAAFDASLANWLRDAADSAGAAGASGAIQAVSQAQSPRVRIALMGSAPPSDVLHSAVAEAGGCIVDEIGDHSLTRLGSAIPSDVEPLAAIAAHYQTLALGPRSFQDRAAELVQRALTARVDGVILWLLEEDEALVWDVPPIRRLLDGAALPLLCLTRRRWDAQDGTLEAIKLFTSRLGKTA